MKVLKLILLAVLLSSGIQAQTSFVSNLKDMVSPQKEETVSTTHHNTFFVENMGDESVLILWESTTIDGFYEIERAQDDGTYTTIVRMDADGTRDFSFLDNEPFAENTYRLKHTSRTGYVSYSDESYVSLLSSDLTLKALLDGE